ncbi:ABC transporter ATP-binding protein/permease [Xylanivirga thermophila]|uniref:ABC transporter ATP-binding protein/permease n=1 Tax=Xylanivirga thermophila TaxID=2496273 RepID=UPI00101DF9B4|nr:ABC transporter transmembrane domain-containing protein [Xylanivirga thermophila]
MIDKNLLNLLGKSKKYIFYNVFFQWLNMLCNIFMILTLVRVLFDVIIGNHRCFEGLKYFFLILILGIVFRGVFRYLADTMSYKTTLRVKSEIRDKIYNKLLAIGPNYKDNIATAEVVQLTIEGVEQLEVYYSKYMPQFFYSILAPLTLFVVLSRYSLKVSLILLLGVPLIPVSIIIVAKFAKKLLNKYWSIYIGLGDSFLENLQGLTTLKIYEADEYKNKIMNEEAEKFRKITMKVLAMQLNSITVMDLVAFGGSAIGMIFTILEYSNGRLELAPALAIILLSSEFFIPMRLLGSFFHVSMNGVSASKKIFKLLQMPEEENAQLEIDPTNMDIVLKDLYFSYEEDREILKGINLAIPKGKFVSIVGESGSGKSTIASLIMGYRCNYKGSLTIGGIELSDISNESIMKHCTYIGHDEYIFKGTVKENLLMGIPKGISITDKEMNEILKLEL